MFFRPGALAADQPVTFSELPPGRYELRVTGPAIERHTEIFVVKADEEADVRPTLQRAGEIELAVDAPADVVGAANVIITDAVTGERVRITGLLNPMLLGMPEPERAAAILVAPLAAGSYRLEIQLRGFKTIVLEANVQTGQRVTRTLELERE
jgi:hypothetical protein